MNAHEQVTPVQPETSAQGFSLLEYEQRLHNDGVRTGRHAAEMGLAPAQAEIKQATALIRQVVKPAFDYESTTPPGQETTLAQAKERYWERASRVSGEHGAKPGFNLEDYFNTGTYRSYEEMRRDFLKRNPEGSMGMSLIDTVDVYHKELEINPAYAATIVSELISKGRGVIGSLAAQYTDLPPTEATHMAFRTFLVDTVPQHITSLQEAYGKGRAIVQVLAKQSFYPQFYGVQSEQPLPVDPDDVRAIIDVFDLQNRPYSSEELTMANGITHDPGMQMAMIGAHERLVDVCRKYFDEHPERLTGNLTSWSEIFVPEYQESGAVELLPNPKLLRAMTNNILPAVAGRLLERGAGIGDIQAEDIEQGVEVAAKKFKLFQTKVGLFRNNPETNVVELGEVTTITCPANQLFPRFLAEHLPTDYAAAKRALAP